VRALGILLAVLVGGAILLQVSAIGGSWWLRGRRLHDQEIAWLERFRPVLVWDSALEPQIERLYRERIRRDLDQGRLDLAVTSLRKALGRTNRIAAARNPELMALGIETFTRAADRMEARGLPAAAAAWDDSLFLLAIRAERPQHRYAAVAAFQEGLDLTVREGDPCRALARLEWAKKGLGGLIPGLQPTVEEDLRVQCRQSSGIRRR
jgi:hypothetical protein